MELFTVTTITPSGPAYGGTRLIAICTTLDRAQEIVINNEGDIYETSNTFAVVEKIGSDTIYGLSGELSKAHWYKWSGDCDTGSYSPCEVPEQFLRIVGYWESGPVRNSVIELRTAIDNPKSDRRLSRALAIVEKGGLDEWRRYFKEAPAGSDVGTKAIETLNRLVTLATE